MIALRAKCLVLEVWSLPSRLTVLGWYALVWAVVVVGVVGRLV